MMRSRSSPRTSRQPGPRSWTSIGSTCAEVREQVSGIGVAAWRSPRSPNYLSGQSRYLASRQKESAKIVVIATDEPRHHWQLVWNSVAR